MNDYTEVAYCYPKLNILVISYFDRSTQEVKVMDNDYDAALERLGFYRTNEWAHYPLHSIAPIEAI